MGRIVPGRMQEPRKGRCPAKVGRKILTPPLPGLRMPHNARIPRQLVVGYTTVPLGA
jgi:hypothetical protein